MIVRLIALWLLCGASTALADTIHLKNGERVVGTIVKREHDMITVQLKSGGTIPYWLDEIDHIEADVAGSEADSASAPGVKEALPFSTAIITYRYSGAQEGTETVYIDVGRSLTASEGLVQQRLGESINEQHDQKIYDGRISTRIDLKTHLAFTVSLKHDLLTGMFGEHPAPEQRKGQETIAGKICDVYEVAGGQAAFWGQIPLRVDITKHPLGPKFNFTKEAVSMQFDVPLPPRVFEIPSGIEVVTPEQFMQELRKVSADAQRRPSNNAKP